MSKMTNLDGSSSQADETADVTRRYRDSSAGAWVLLGLGHWQAVKRWVLAPASLFSGAFQQLRPLASLSGFELLAGRRG